MASGILTIPNLLSVMRMGLIPLFAIFLFYGLNGWALFVFVIAGLSDGVDGYIARRFNQESQLGTIIDPIADKLMMTVSFIVLSMPSLAPHTDYLPVPFWVTAIVIGRDVLILTVAFAIFVVTGFRDFEPSTLGKLSTFFQILAITLILAALAFPGIGDFYLPAVYLSVVVLAFLSGIQYIFHVAKLMRSIDET